MGASDRAVRFYVRALDLSGVLVAVRGDAEAPAYLGLVKGHGADTRRIGKNVRTVNVLWCVGPAQAEALAAGAIAQFDHVGARSRGAWFSMTAGEAIESVQAAADQLGLAIKEHSEVEAAAALAVARIEQTFEDLRRRGELKSVNKAYQQYRLAARAQGRGTINYAMWIENYKMGLIREVAVTSRTLDRRAFGFLQIKSDKRPCHCRKI